MLKCILRSYGLKCVDIDRPSSKAPAAGDDAADDATADLPDA